jgi:SAM-dependent methyltransferase
VTSGDGYLLANQQADSGRRLDALAELFDPVTFRHLDALGLAPGWCCWEVGAGGPSVPSWLADRVRPAGRVVASDIDTSWMRAAGARYEVICHDVGTDQPPAGPFDLVHARLVLVHVPSRTQAITSTVQSLRPGGWLLVEDADPALQPLICPDEVGPPQQLANQLRRAFRTLLAHRGADLSFGRTLPRLLREAGLTNVEADAFFPITSPACTRLEIATVGQIRNRLTASGLATEAEIDQHLRNVATGQLDLATAPMISAWTQRSDEA